MLCLSLPAAAQEFVPGRVLVRYRAGQPSGRIQPRALHHMSGAQHVLEVHDTAATLRALAADPDVLYAEPDYIRHRYSVDLQPNDEMYRYQWALPMVHAAQAW